MGFTVMRTTIMRMARMEMTTRSSINVKPLSEVTVRGRVKPFLVDTDDDKCLCIFIMELL